MTCAELKERLGAYAIGALAPAEKAEVDAHFASAQPHDGCWEELRAANEAATLVALSVPAVEPSRALWESIEAKLDKQVHAAPAPKQTSSWAWVSAALLVLVVVLGWQWLHMQLVAEHYVVQNLNDRSELLTATTAHEACVAELDKAKADGVMQAKALELLQRSGVKLVAMAPQPGSTQTANVIFAPDTHEAYVVGHGLAAPADKDFELWIIRGDQKIAAGLLKGRDANGSLIAQIDPKVLGTTPPDAFAVSLEAKGGGAQPAGSIVLVGKI